MPSVRTPDPNPGWLSEFALEETRSRVPILYVEAVPTRVDTPGQIEQVGVLLRGSAATELPGPWCPAASCTGSRSARPCSATSRRTSARPRSRGCRSPRSRCRRRVLPAARRRPARRPAPTRRRPRLRRAGDRRVRPPPGRPRTHVADPQGSPRDPMSSTISKAAAAPCCVRRSPTPGPSRAERLRRLGEEDDVALVDLAVPVREPHEHQTTGDGSPGRTGLRRCQRPACGSRRRPSGRGSLAIPPDLSLPSSFLP